VDVVEPEAPDAAEPLAVEAAEELLVDSCAPIEKVPDSAYTSEMLLNR
jgi:hypothetical protein